MQCTGPCGLEQHLPFSSDLKDQEDALIDFLGLIENEEIILAFSIFSV